MNGCTKIGTEAAATDGQSNNSVTTLYFEPIPLQSLAR
jgi:hypothetical protein